MSAKIESLTKECSSLKQKIDDMSKGGEKTKQDLHQKNSSLLSQVSQLENKVKEMEIDLSAEKLKSSEIGKENDAKIKVLVDEKAKLEASVKKAQTQDTGIKSELEKARTSIKALEGEKTTLKTQLSQIQKGHLAQAASKGDDIKAQAAKIQVWPLTQLFPVSFLWQIISPHLGNTILFRSSQQLHCLCLGPLKGFLS